MAKKEKEKRRGINCYEKIYHLKFASKQYRREGM